MIFDIYLPNGTEDSVTYYTSIEANDELEAEQIAQQMMDDEIIPSVYPY